MTAIFLARRRARHHFGDHMSPPTYSPIAVTPYAPLDAKKNIWRYVMSSEGSGSYAMRLEGRRARGSDLELL